MSSYKNQCVPACIARLTGRSLESLVDSRAGGYTIHGFIPTLYHSGYWAMEFCLKTHTTEGLASYKLDHPPSFYLQGECGILDDGTHCRLWLYDIIWDPAIRDYVSLELDTLDLFSFWLVGSLV